MRSSSPMAVWAGPELILIYNDGYPPVLGPSRHPWALGRPAREVWADVWALIGDELDQVMRRGEAVFVEDRRIPLRRGDNEEDAFFVYSFTPIVADDGAVIGALHLFNETTKRVRVERDFQRIFELSNDLLAVVETDGRFYRVNPAFERTLGWTEAELLAHSVEFFLHPDDRQRTLSQLASGHSTQACENRYRHKDGSYRWVSWAASPVIEDGLIYAAGHDITERKRVDERERLVAATSAYRLRLADALRSIVDPDELQARAARELGETLGATRVHYGRVSDDGECCFVTGEYLAPGVASMMGTYRFEDYGPMIARELRAGRSPAIADVGEEPQLSSAQRLATMALGLGAYVAVPLVKLGRLVALLVVHQSTPRNWTEHDLGLMQDTAERTWAAVEQADAKQALAHSEARLRETLRHASAGVFEWRLESGEVFWSPETYALYGLDPAVPCTFEVWESAVHPDDAEQAKAEILAAYEGGAPEFRGEFRIMHPKLGVRWLLGYGKVERGPDGQPIRVRGLNLDITPRKQAEEEVREADRRKTEFLAMLSHELRNPLAPIRNAIELLGSAPAGSDLGARALAILDRQSAHLARIVDDLLDVTRISRAKVQLERQILDLREIVSKTADDLRAEFDASGVELRVELIAGPVLVDADATRIAQVVSNLLNNARKFTPSGGAVTIAVDVGDGTAELCVRDTGAGMPPDEVARMFEPFAQADQPLARPLGGLGLGLALVKGLVELHGGSVAARSEGRDRGAEFTLSLPLASDPKTEPEQGRGRTREGGRRVLVIEDNIDAGQTLADLLTLRGHEIRLAFDGTSGLAAAREFSPEIVICDIGLPDISGHEVARALRGDVGLGGVKLIALSGYAQPEDRKLAREAGFDEHLPKPAPLDRLYALLC